MKITPFLMLLRRLVAAQPALAKREYRTVQELYDHVDTVTEALRSAGFAHAAARIHGLLHETAWTTGNELMGELGICFASILKTTPSMPPAIAGELKGLVREIGRAQRTP